MNAEIRKQLEEQATAHDRAMRRISDPDMSKSMREESFLAGAQAYEDLLNTPTPHSSAQVAATGEPGHFVEHTRNTSVSADDERDARKYANSQHLGALADSPWRLKTLEDFLAGRKGMVSASEVERLKAIIRNASTLQAEAVKAERERCAIVCNSFMGWGEPAFMIRNEILTPEVKS